MAAIIGCPYVECDQWAGSWLGYLGLAWKLAAKYGLAYIGVGTLRGPGLHAKVKSLDLLEGSLEVQLESVG